jgi:hypothetical protein
MKEVFVESSEQLEELETVYNLEDCGMSGKYPDYHWLQDDENGIAVYYKSNIFEA